jgi:long-chain acyl-CoA synthetase
MPQNDASATLNHLFFHHLDHYRHDRLLAYQNHGTLMVWSTEQFSQAVFALRKYLFDAGFQPGDRVAIFSENRPEWHIADFAILLARMVVVPIYNTLAPSQIGYLLAHSGCRAVIVAGEPQRDTLAKLRGELPELRTIIGMEDLAGVDISLPRLTAGAGTFDAPAIAGIRAEAEQAAPGDLATIVYTSGTTGTPKGVMLSHRNITFDLKGSLARTESQTARQALSVLPLAHVLERVLCYGYFERGIPIGYGDPYDLKELLPVYRPQIMGVVPRILEKIKESVEAEINLLWPHRRFIAHKLLAAAMARTRAELMGTPAGALARIFAPLANAVVFPKVHRKLGGLEYLICGGAWLNPEIELFFRAAGFAVLQGYGMTETSPVITLNEYRHEKVGSVGAAIDGVEVRLSGDGEILTRGPHVMLGYYKDDAGTRQTFTEDGWLRTGDLGRIDEAGRVTITGRRKEILVLSNGKNIACAALEQALARSPYIQQVLIVGEGRKYVAAMIVPHAERMAHVAREHGLAGGAHGDWLLAAPIVELFRRELDSLQAEFSNFEKAKRFCFLSEEALLDTELVTPTLKVRRAVLERKYAGWIGRIYQQEDPLVIPPPSQLETVSSYKTA